MSDDHPQISVRLVPVMPELLEAQRLARAAVDKERADLDPETRALVEAIDAKVGASLDRFIFGDQG